MANQQDWPVDKIGFRQRGMDMTRLETFTDAAFAFALTLLVISIDSIPNSYSELMTGLKQAPAFGASFATIMLFWYGHHIWSRRFGLDDLVSIYLTFFLVFIVLVFVYPLKMTFAGAFEFFTRNKDLYPVHIESVEEARGLFLVYSSAFGLLSLNILLLNYHALRVADALHLNALERHDTNTAIGTWAIYAGVALLSCLLAFTLPDGTVFMAGLIYMILGFLMPWHAIRRYKRRPPASA